jgi:hypothetical protein
MERKADDRFWEISTKISQGGFEPRMDANDRELGKAGDRFNRPFTNALSFWAQRRIHLDSAKSCRDIPLDSSLRPE